ncbi:MAG: hypothetical protein LBS60_06625 [Deltaproteobacteria bacterium]|jgi:tetratricopeptide (TPR) repeat protein|nr:hypothetical protein [Deltaproteobacteria bacterium]
MMTVAKGSIIARLILLALLIGAPLACGGPLPPNDPFNLGQAKDSLAKGNHWYLRGCHKEAARFFTEGLIFARLADNAPLMVMAHNSLGTALLAQGQLNAAANQLAKALDLTETLPNKPELDSVLGNLGTLAFKAQRPLDAAEFWEAALVAAPPSRKAIYLANLARLQQNDPSSPKFMEYVAAANAAATDQDTPLPAKADAWSLAALLAFTQGDIPEASERLAAALALDRQTENVSGLAQNLELAGKIQIKQEAYPQAAQSFDRAFYLYAALGERTALGRIVELLKTTHQKGFPKDLSPYQKILHNPTNFQPLTDSCP